MQTSEELKNLLGYILPHPKSNPARVFQDVKESVEKDLDIEHLIWEIAQDDNGRYYQYRDLVLDVFEDNWEETDAS